MQSTTRLDSHPTASTATTPLKDIQKTLPLRVLSIGRLASLDDERLRHRPTRSSAANVERLVDVLWQFDEKDPGDPSTWDTPQRRDHAMTELNHTGMLEIYNHQALWDNRMEPARL